MQQHRCYFCEEQDYLMKQIRGCRERAFSPEEIALEMDPESRTLDDIVSLVEEITKLLE